MSKGHDGVVHESFLNQWFEQLSSEKVDIFQILEALLAVRWSLKNEMRNSQNRRNFWRFRKVSVVRIRLPRGYDEITAAIWHVFEEISKNPLKKLSFSPTEKMNFKKLQTYETGWVIVPDCFGISESFQHGIGLQNNILDFLGFISTPRNLR